MLAYYLAPAPTLSGTSLAHSLTRAADGDKLGALIPCERHDELWRCTIGHANGSDLADYRVDMHSSRCWRARLVLRHDEIEPMPARLEGCVRLRDQVRPLNRLLNDLF